MLVGAGLRAGGGMRTEPPREVRSPGFWRAPGGSACDCGVRPGHHARGAPPQLTRTVSVTEAPPVTVTFNLALRLLCLESFASSCLPLLVSFSETLCCLPAAS